LSNKKPKCPPLKYYSKHWKKVSVRLTSVSNVFLANAGNTIVIDIGPTDKATCHLSSILQLLVKLLAAMQQRKQVTVRPL